MSAAIKKNSLPELHSSGLHWVQYLIAKFFILFLGSILLVPFGYKLYNYCDLRYHAVAVYGVVEDPLQGGALGSRPFVEYKDLKGHKYGFKTEAKTHWFFAPQKGEKIRVLFLENEPQTAIADSLFHYGLLPLFFSLIGSALCFYTIKQAWQDFKKHQK